MSPLELVVTEPAAELLREHGSRVYVWTKERHCCGGGQTLEAAFDPPPGRDFRQIENAAGIELYMPAQLGRLPDELQLDLQRHPRRIRAYWNGCVWVL